MLDHVDELIESTQETDTTTGETPQDSMKNWIGWALALSLVLHIGAAVVLIVMGESSIGGDNSSRFIIQDVVLTPTPTISAPVTPEPVPSDEQQAAVTAPPPTESGGTPLPAEEPVPATPAATPESTEKAGGPMSTPLGLGMTHGYFSSLANGKTLRDDIRDYYLEMVQGINRAWWDKAVQLKEPLRQDAIFEVKIKRDGTIVGVQIVNGTGSRAADRLLVDVIMKASPLPALPPAFTESLFSAPLRIRAPSFFFRLNEG